MPIPTRAIPIFPLPGCVVLPGAVQALHIFEARYRQMTVDELSHPSPDRLLATALLRPGFEDSYYTDHAAIHPTLCLCTIIEHEGLPDGRHNILIRGDCRVTIRQNCAPAGYRRAILEPQETIDDLLPEEQQALRRRLTARLDALPDNSLQLSEDMACAMEQNFERLVDLLTYHLFGPEAAPAKQMILAEARLDFRAKMLITLIERVFLRRRADGSGADVPPGQTNN